MRHQGLGGAAVMALLVALAAAVGATQSGPRPGSAPASAAGAQDARFEAVAKLVAEKMTAYRIPGVAIAVLQDDRVTTRGLGVTNVDDPQPVTPETIFALASISKTVTATALVKLAEQKKVNLTAPVRTYLPDFRVADADATRDVTVLHLLTHTPGWEGQLTVPDHGVNTLADFVSSMSTLPSLAPPGRVWSYNNAGFTVAGRIIEVVTGRSYQDAVRALVFQPAQLPSATTVLGEVTTHRFAVGHRDRNGKTEVVRPFILSANIPAGGVAMNVGDLMTYAKFHLTDPALAPMRQPQLRKNATDEDMGIAWQLRTVGGVATAAHGGTAAGGLCLLLELVPDRHLAFAILTNHTNGWRLIQDVERFALQSYAGVALATNQGIAHRGVDEVMSHAMPLGTQPSPDEYVGTYTRPPVGTVTVRVDSGRMLVAGQGAGGGSTGLLFYARDRAFLVDGAGVQGLPVEFIRDEAGRVGWIRIDGRIARRQ